MSGLEFADTNVVVYAVGLDSDQRTKARQILAEGVTVSSQVINETVNVLTRKQGVNIVVAHEVAESLLGLAYRGSSLTGWMRKALLPRHAVWTSI